MADARQAALVAAARDHPTEFTALAKRGYSVTPFHLALGDVLRAAAFRLPCPDPACGCDMDRIIIEAPPRHGKSELASIHFPPWYLGHFPDHRIIGTAYGADLAAGFGGDARDLTQSPRYRAIFPHVNVIASSSAKDHWELDGWDGGYIAAGVNGPITGRGAHVLLIEDPVKNAQEARSLTYRDSVWHWYRTTAYPRLEGRGIVIVIMTRWHEDDLTGRLLAEQLTGGDQWHRVTFPALNDRGEALWPQKFSAETLAKIRKVLKNDFYALFQQRPTPEEGAVFKRAWFEQRWHDLPGGVLAEAAAVVASTYTDAGLWRSPPTAPPPRQRPFRIIQAIDTAFKAGVGSDFSVIATWGTDGVDYYLIDLWRGRVEYPELKAAIVAAGRRSYGGRRVSAVVIEDQASGQSVIQDLRRNTNLPVIPVRPGGSKESRADAVAPFFEAGKVYLPQSAPWLEDFIAEHLTFPNGTHDDMVDTTSLALARLAVDPVYTGPVIAAYTLSGRRRARSAV